jgi:hypothetical protein
LQVLLFVHVFVPEQLSLQLQVLVFVHVFVPEQLSLQLQVLFPVAPTPHWLSVTQVSTVCAPQVFWLRQVLFTPQWSPPLKPVSHVFAVWQVL